MTYYYNISAIYDIHLQLQVIRQERAIYKEGESQTTPARLSEDKPGGPCNEDCRQNPHPPHKWYVIFCYPKLKSWENNKM